MTFFKKGAFSYKFTPQKGAFSYKFTPRKGAFSYTQASTMYQPQKVDIVLV